ncbi:protein O-mannosyl-transferase [Gammaproteobacteria bacterium]
MDCNQPGLIMVMAYSKNYFIIFSLIIMAVAIYLPGIREWAVLDDFINITQNIDIHWRYLGWNEFTAAVDSGISGPFGRPLAMLSFGLNYYFNPQNPLSSAKLTNIVLHAISGVLVYNLALKLLPYWRPHTPDIQWFAFFIGLLWVLHPLHVSTVLYTVQRMTLLSGLFCLVGLLAFVHGRERLMLGEEDGVWWIACGNLIAGGLAVLSKENGALLGHFELVLELIFFRFSASSRLGRKKFIAMATVAIPIFVISGYLLQQCITGSGYGSRSFNLIQRLLTEARILWFYIWLLVVPDHTNMSLYHDDLEISTGWLQPWTTLPAVILWLIVVIASMIAWRRKQALPLVFGLWWFLVTHLLESTVIPLELVFEHRNYLAVFGIVMPMVFYFGIAITKITGRKLYVLVVGATLIGTLWIAEVWARVNEWTEIRSFFSTLLLRHPQSPRAWAEAASLMVDVKDFVNAVANYQQAAALDKREAGYRLREVCYRMVSGQEVTVTLLEDTRYRLSQYPITPITILALLNLGKIAENFDATQREKIIPILRAAVANLNWSNHNVRGLGYFRLGNLEYYNGYHDAALRNWELAVDLMPKKIHWRGVMLDLVDIYLAREMKDKARNTLAKIEAEGMDDVDSEQWKRFTRVRHLIQDGDTTK